MMCYNERGADFAPLYLRSLRDIYKNVYLADNDEVLA